MCGILGDIGPGFSAGRFRQALQELRHRGPFGEGVIELSAGALGMTRLPMSSEAPLPLPVRLADDYVAYNGEVYAPEAEIADEVRLLVDGMAEGTLPDGMFALAYWQPHHATLTLQRDSYGIKPLYYCYQADRGRLMFASELTPLLTLLGKRTPNSDAIAQVVATGVTLAGESLFAGIQLVAPGEQLRFTLRDGRAWLRSRQPERFLTLLGEPAPLALREPVQLLLDPPPAAITRLRCPVSYVIPGADQLTSMAKQRQFAQRVQAREIDQPGGHLAPLQDLRWLIR